MKSKQTIVRYSFVLLVLMSALSATSTAQSQEKVRPIRQITKPSVTPAPSQLNVALEQYVVGGGDRTSITAIVLTDYAMPSGHFIPKDTKVRLRAEPVGKRGITFVLEPIILKDGTKVIVSTEPYLLHIPSGEAIRPSGKGKEKYFKAALIPQKLSPLPGEDKVITILNEGVVTRYIPQGVSGSAIAEIAWIVLRIAIADNVLVLPPKTVLCVNVYPVAIIKTTPAIAQPIAGTN